MGQARNWTRKEDDYLEENWGTISVPGMAAKLNRSRRAIKERASKKGLGRFLESGEYITLHQLEMALSGREVGGGYTHISWGEKRGLPVHTKLRDQQRVRVVYLSEFWAWAEKNRAYIDFSKMQPLALGEEPPWATEQRAKDARSFPLQQKRPWLPDEDALLIDLLKMHKYTWPEVSERLRRSEGAIQRRCTDLGLKERPLRASTATDRPWDDEAFKILADGIRAGDSYAVIGHRLGKSEKAVRGKVYATYLTEDADKVRAMMGAGPWGGWRAGSDSAASRQPLKARCDGETRTGSNRRNITVQGHCNGLGEVLAAQDVPALERRQGLLCGLFRLRQLHGVFEDQASILLPVRTGLFRAGTKPLLPGVPGGQKKTGAEKMGASERRPLKGGKSVYILNGPEKEIINSEFVERFCIIEHADTAMIIASYGADRSVTLSKYRDLPEARSALGDMLAALARGQTCYEMPESSLFCGQYTIKDARTRRKGGS